MWSKADIVLGSASTPLSQLYSMAYEINFNESLIETDSVFVAYTPSFINPGNNVNFRKNFRE